MSLGFEWDDEKAAANFHVHGVSFEDAARACNDAFAIIWFDARYQYDEERYGLLGLCGSVLLYVAYTERGDNLRIISARRASKHEQHDYYRQNAR